MPSNTLVGALRVEATLDAGKFIDGARRIQASAKQTESSIKQSFSGMSASIKAGIAGFVGAFALMKLTDGIKSALEYAGSLAEVAQQLGVTAKQLQIYRYVAGQVGVSHEQLEVGLKKLNQSLGQAKLGAEAPAKAFGALSKLIGTDIVKASKQGGDALPLVADALAKVADRSKRAGAEAALMGKSGSALDNMLSGGSRAINELAAEAEHLGIILSDEQIANADKTADKLRQLKDVLATEIASVVSSNANSIYSLAKALGDLTGEIIRFLNSNPRTALAIIGALAGSRFGLPGAAIGAIGGVVLGGHLAQVSADSNSDLQFRMQQVRSAKAALAAAQKAPSSPGYRFGQNEANVANSTAQRSSAVRAAIGELRRQTGLLNQAVTASKAGRMPKESTADIGNFLAPKAPKAPKEKKPPKDKSSDIEFQFLQEQMQADQQILQAKMQLAGSSEQRAALEVQSIKLEHDIQDAQIKHNVEKAKQDFADGKITAAALQEVELQAQGLKAKNDQITQLKLQAFVEEQLTRQEQANFEASDQRFRFTQDNLRVADQLATTTEDHRRIQLQILDSEMAQRRYELEHEKQLAVRNGATSAQIKVIQDQIDNLSQERANGAAAINRNTQNPLEAWAQTVPKTAAEINEALQSIEVKGIDGLSDALTDVITGTTSLKEAFHQLAASVLRDLIAMTIKMLIFKAIQAAMGGGFGGGGPDLSGSMDFSGSFGAISNAPAFAAGGSILIGGRSGTDKNLLSMNGLPIARVSMGERINISNDNGGGAFPPATVVYQTFDLHGAVVTSDLLRQMDEKSQRAAQEGAKLGVKSMMDLNSRTYGKALGG
jgi:hypothetical protein